MASVPGYRDSDDVIEWMLNVDDETFGWLEAASWVFSTSGFRAVVQATAGVRRMKEKAEADA